MNNPFREAEDFLVANFDHGVYYLVRLFVLVSLGIFFFGFLTLFNKGIIGLPIMGFGALMFYLSIESSKAGHTSLFKGDS